MAFKKNLQPFLDIGSAEAGDVKIEFYSQMNKMTATVKSKEEEIATIVLAPKGKLKLNFNSAVDIIISAVEKMTGTGDSKNEENAPETKNEKQVETPKNDELARKTNQMKKSNQARQPGGQKRRRG